MTSSHPRALRVLCALVVLEAAAFGGLAIAWGADLVRGRATMVGATVFLAVFFLAVAGLLGLCARGLWRGRRWARSPVVMWQILLAVLALGWFRSDPSLWAVVVVVVAAVIGCGLLVPGVLRRDAEGADGQARPGA